MNEGSRKEISSWLLAAAATCLPACLPSLVVCVTPFYFETGAAHKNETQFQHPRMRLRFDRQCLPGQHNIEKYIRLHAFFREIERHHIILRYLYEIAFFGKQFDRVRLQLPFSHCEGGFFSKHSIYAGVSFEGERESLQYTACCNDGWVEQEEEEEEQVPKEALKQTRKIEW